MTVCLFIYAAEWNQDSCWICNFLPLLFFFLPCKHWYFFKEMLIWLFRSQRWNYSKYSPYIFKEIHIIDDLSYKLNISFLKKTQAAFSQEVSIGVNTDIHRGIVVDLFCSTSNRKDLQLVVKTAQHILGSIMIDSLHLWPICPFSFCENASACSFQNH